MSTHRPPEEWDSVFLEIARTVAKKSKDNSTICGAVLVDEENHILSCGFNGPPPQIEDESVPWNKRPEKYSFICHAEDNALWYAADGWGANKIKGSTMYINAHPCSSCVLKMIRAGVKNVIYEDAEKPIVVNEFDLNLTFLILKSLKKNCNFNIRKYEKNNS